MKFSLDGGVFPSALFSFVNIDAAADTALAAISRRLECLALVPGPPRIEHHGAFVNLAQNRVQPLPINPAIWRKMRRRGKRFLSEAS